MVRRSHLSLTPFKGFVIASFGIALCKGVPVQSTTPLFTPRQLSESQCTVAGNPDLYGLGIRVGVYLQWVSGFLANCFHASSIQDMLSTNTIFLMALFIALAIITTNHTITAPEVIILLQFCFGFLFSVSTTWGLRVQAPYKERVKFPLLGSTIRVCLASAICFYNVWFWFVGIDKLRDPACHPMGFLFARVDLMDRARNFLKVVAVFASVVYGSTTISECLFFFCNWIFYSSMTALIAILLALRPNSMPSGLSSRWGIVGITFKYCSVVLGGIPWIMMNEENEFRLKRPHFWILCLIFASLFGFFMVEMMHSIVRRLWGYIERLWEVLCACCGTSKTDDRHPHLSNSVPTPMLNNALSDYPTSNKDATMTLGTEDKSESKPIISGPPEVPIPDVIEPETTIPRHPIHTPSVEAAARKTEPERNPNPSQAEAAPNLNSSKSESNRSIFYRLGKGAWREVWKEHGDYKTSDHKTIILLPIINLLYLIWSILAVELTIRWNKITGVHTIQSVGQLIPFIIGIVGFLKLVRDISVEQTGIWLYKVVITSILTFNQSSQKTRKETFPSDEEILDILSSRWPPTIIVDLSESHSPYDQGVERKILDQSTACPQCGVELDLKFDDSVVSLSDIIRQRHEMSHHQAPNSRYSKPISTSLRSYLRFLAYLPKLLLRKKERELAKSTPMLRDSIGDQITSILHEDATKDGESTQKTNARLALANIDEFREDWRKAAGSNKDLKKLQGKLVKELRQLDIDPHLLAVRWLRIYTKDWWDYIQERYEDSRRRNS